MKSKSRLGGKAGRTFAGATLLGGNSCLIAISVWNVIKWRTEKMFILRVLFHKSSNQFRALRQFLSVLVENHLKQMNKRLDVSPAINSKYPIIVRAVPKRIEAIPSAQRRPTYLNVCDVTPSL